MAFSLQQFKNFLKNDDILLYNGVNKHLVIENKQYLKKLYKLTRRTYTFKELSVLMKYLLPKELFNELNDIHVNGKIYSNNGYFSSVKVNNKSYNLPVKFDNAVEVCSDLTSKHIFPYEDSFAFITFDIYGKSEITPGFSLHERNIKIDNGKDWIRHYVGRADRGVIYKIKCEKNNMTFYKYGISKNIDTRIKQLSNNLKIIKVEKFENLMFINAIIERAFHMKYISKKLHFNDKFDGSNECYVLDIPIPSLDESFNILNENNYTISTKLLKIILNEIE